MEKEYEEWIKLRNESVDEHNEKLCYCGHTHRCECSDPDITLFKESVERRTIILGDSENGWRIPLGHSWPTDSETEKWFEENIGMENNCSASSAIYKFRLWLREREEESKKTNT